MLLLEDKRYYVYIYLDTRKQGNFIYPKLRNLGLDYDEIFEYLPFYVGKGCGSRAEDGLVFCGYNPFKERIIKKITDCKLVPLIFKLKENLLEKDAYLLEKNVIASIGRFDLGKGPLCNLTDGGEGPSGKILSEETKQKISIRIQEISKDPLVRERLRKAALGKIRHSMPHSPETKKRIGEAAKGRKDSEDTRKKKSNSFKGRKYSSEHNQKISKALTGKKLSDEHRKSLSESHKGLIPKNSMAVQNIETLEIFNSISEAERKYKVDGHNIAKCCRGKREVCGGFHWRFIES